MVNPKLRFKADDGTEFPDYQSVLLISLADVRDGTHDSPKYHSQGFPFVTSKNLTDNGKIDFSNVNLISENDYNNINKRSKVDVGDILFGLIGTIGRPVIVEADGFAIKNVALIKPNHNAVNNQYLYHLMCSSSFNNQLRDSMTGGNQKFVSLSMLRSMRVTVPIFEEQRKIAEFLSTFDSKVEAKEQQLEALQETKKGLLQQIFSQQLRFKADDGTDFPEWECLSLSDIAFYVKDKLKRYSGLFIGVEHMLKNFSGVSFNSLEDSAGTHFVCNDILLSNIRPYLKKLWIADRDGICSSDVLVIRSKNIEPLLLNYLLASDVFFNHIKAGYKGSKMPRGDKTQIMEYQFMAPADREEQRKIAEFLSTFDSKVEAKEQQLEALQETKKGLLQQIFSQQLRFKADDGTEFPEWTQTSIAKIAKVIGGGTPSTKNPEYWYGDVLWFTPSEINSKYLTRSQKCITSLGVQNSSAKILPKNTLLLTTRASLGLCSINNLEQLVSTNQGFQSLVCNDNVNHEFLYYCIATASFQNEMLRLSSGSTFKEISSTALKSICVDVPCLEEQRKIAEFFGTFDEKIEAVKRQLEALKEIKKGLLQQMFV